MAQSAGTLLMPSLTHLTFLIEALKTKPIKDNTHTSPEDHITKRIDPVESNQATQPI